MESIKLLIANPDGEFCQALCTALASELHICTCDTGTQAMELLGSYRPQIIVMDLVLSGYDGLAILHRLAEEADKPRVLVVSRFISPYVSDTLEKLGIMYVMRQPCNIQALAEHIRDLACELEPPKVQTVDVNAASANLLLQLGMPAKLDGFLYLQAALPLYMADRNQSLTKELYSTVGKMYGKDAIQVERSIRNAIDIAWNQRDDEVWRSYFPTPAGVPVPRPSNGHFIGIMSVQLSFIVAA